MQKDRYDLFAYANDLNTQNLIHKFKRIYEPHAVIKYFS